MMSLVICRFSGQTMLATLDGAKNGGLHVGCAVSECVALCKFLVPK
jgi:hypothetical protein